MKYAFIDRQRRWHTVEALCRALGVARSGFYAWRAREPSAHAHADHVLAKRVAEVHTRSRQSYGVSRVQAALAAAGHRHSRRRIHRLMRAQGLTGVVRRRRRVRTTDSAHDLPVAPNRLGRDFSPAAPNTAWAADITYVPTAEGWLYLATVIDLYSRRIVGWSQQHRLHTDLVLSALTMAVKHRRPGPGLIHHSDRGSQYASQAYRGQLREHAMVCSMSRRANCYDNAVMESFYATLKTELVYRQPFVTRDQARQAIFEWIEIFYNRQRLHSTLGFKSPAEYEALAPK